MYISIANWGNLPQLSEIPNLYPKQKGFDLMKHTGTISWFARMFCQRFSHGVSDLGQLGYCPAPPHISEA